MTLDNVILLVEDNPRDEELTLRALKKSNVLNPVVVARDGVAALDYLFGRGAHAGRDLTSMPQLVLLDLKLPGSRCSRRCAPMSGPGSCRWSR